MNIRKLVTAGLAAGVLLNLLNIVAQVMLGMMSIVTYAMLEALQLAAFLIAAWVGARIYST